MNEIPIRCLIIDDEEPARQLIRSYLIKTPEIEVVGEAQNGFEALKMIQADQPDLIFLDVQMPKINGFEMLELIEQPPCVIFSTAFDQYAIRAFDQNAIDYLLKPYSLERFTQALTRAVERIRTSTVQDPRVARLGLASLPQGEYLDRIVVRTGSRIKVVAVGLIEFIEAEDDYVMLYTPDGRFLKQMTMNHLEESLDPREFIRIHRSSIIRLDRITQIEPYDKETKVVVLQSGKKIKTSKSGLKRLKEVLGL